MLDQTKIDQLLDTYHDLTAECQVDARNAMRDVLQDVEPANRLAYAIELRRRMTA